MSRCYACDLTSGREPLIGGRIAATHLWVVEHCMGPLGVGTLIVKPFRHVLDLAALDGAEVWEMGSLLKEAARVVTVLTRCDRVYVSLWSHANWQPVHIHFVVQPVHNSMKAISPDPGPALQTEMFRVNEPLPAPEVEAFCDEARRVIRLEELAQ
jgi:diadenosine tetraphosphate (Ap4A) HIT family hydrolase